MAEPMKSVRVLAPPADSSTSSAVTTSATPPSVQQQRQPVDPRADARRSAHEAEAYRLQIKGATEGGIKGLIIGGLFVTFLHLQFPLVRRQTLAGKTFLASWFGIFGLVTQADKYLLRFEAYNRIHDNAIRDKAMADLSSKGMLPTEHAIRQWRDRYDEDQAKRV